MKRLALLLLLPLMVLGCSQSQEMKVLTFSAPADISGVDLKLVELFNLEQKNFQVKLMPSVWKEEFRYQDYLKKPLPDILSLDDKWTPEFAAAGLIEPLDTYLTMEVLSLEGFFSGTIAASKYQDRLYALPWYTSLSLLYVRKDLLKEVYYKTPKTWRGLLLAARAARQKNRTLAGYVFAGAETDLLAEELLSYILANGGRIFEKEKVIINSDPTLQALDFLKRLKTTYGLIPSEVFDYDAEKARKEFQYGKALFLSADEKAFRYLSNPQETALSGKIVVTSLPRGPKGKEQAPLIKSMNLMINKKSIHKKEAFEFMVWLLSKKAQTLKAIKSEKLPALKEGYQDLKLRKEYPYYQELYPLLLKAKARPRSPYYQEILAVLALEFKQVLTGDKSSSKALLAVQEKIKKLTLKKP